LHFCRCFFITFLEKEEADSLSFGIGSFISKADKKYDQAQLYHIKKRKLGRDVNNGRVLNLPYPDAHRMLKFGFE
jgi:hypothetical protein